MTSPSMQPDRDKSHKPAKGAQPAKGARPAGRRRLDGDPATTVDVTIAWGAGGVTVTFPEAASSATWNANAMTSANGNTRYNGNGRNPTNSLSAVINGATYSNSGIANGTSPVTLTLQ